MLIDAIGALLLLAACIKGWRRGLVMSFFSLVAWLIGIMAALKLSAIVAVKMQDHFSSLGKWLPFLSFLLIFISVALLIRLGGKLIESAAETVMLGWANRLAGAALFVCLYACLYSIMLFYLLKLGIFSEQGSAGSLLYPYLAPIGPALAESVGSVIPVFKNVFNQLDAFFDQVSNKLQP